MHSDEKSAYVILRDQGERDTVGDTHTRVRGGGTPSPSLPHLPAAAASRRGSSPSDNCHHSLILTSFLLNILPRAFKPFTNCN